MPSGPSFPEWITTSMVVEQLRRGESGAWSLALSRFQEPVIRLGKRAGLSLSDAEDATQESLQQLFQSLQSGKFAKEKGKLRSWLYGIAWNTILKKRDRRPESTASVQTESRVGPLENLVDEATLRRDFEDTFEAAILAQAMSRARHEFDPKTWQVFEALQLQGLSPAEAASLYQLTKNAVFIAKHRVLKRLRALVSELEEAD